MTVRYPCDEGVVLAAPKSRPCAASAKPVVLAAAILGSSMGFIDSTVANVALPALQRELGATFPEQERGQAIGTWSAFSAVTAALGPVLGGWLIEHLSWRWAFFMNVPIAAVVLLLLFWRVPESRDPSASGRLDVPGVLLATAG